MRLTKSPVMRRLGHMDHGTSQDGIHGQRTQLARAYPKGMATSRSSARADLYNAPFFRYLEEPTRSLLRAAYPPRLNAAPARPLTPVEEYVQECFVSAGELVVACNQLEYALVYLSGYRQRRTADGSLITRADYVAYQIENFMIRLGTVTDRALRLVNVVFQLGIQPKECRRSVIADNAHVAPTPVRKQPDRTPTTLLR